MVKDVKKKYWEYLPVLALIPQLKLKRYGLKNNLIFLELKTANDNLYSSLTLLWLYCFLLTSRELIQGECKRKLTMWSWCLTTVPSIVNIITLMFTVWHSFDLSGHSWLGLIVPAVEECWSKDWCHAEKITGSVSVSLELSFIYFSSKKKIFFLDRYLSIHLYHNRYISFISIVNVIGWKHIFSPCSRLLPKCISLYVCASHLLTAIYWQEIIIKSTSTSNELML